METHIFQQTLPIKENLSIIDMSENQIIKFNTIGVHRIFLYTNKDLPILLEFEHRSLLTLLPQPFVLNMKRINIVNECNNTGYLNCFKMMGNC